MGVSRDARGIRITACCADSFDRRYREIVRLLTVLESAE